VHQLLVTANNVPTSPILVTLMMVAPSSSQTSVFTRATWRDIPEDGILNMNIPQVKVHRATGWCSIYLNLLVGKQWRTWRSQCFKMTVVFFDVTALKVSLNNQLEKCLLPFLDNLVQE
jgi:hypothetical protein